MKKIIYKINQNLLEKYPIIWNTRLIWMLLTSFILHIIFYVLGFLSLTNPKVLHEYNAKSIFFNNGTVFISVILSILTLVIWLIYLFKNNAFKSFYPINKSALFKQFCCYLIIIFSSTTYFISHSIGLRSYMSYKYPDQDMNKEIKASNVAATFFSQDIETYTLNERKYPKPFDSLYCKTYLGTPSESLNKVKTEKDTVANTLKFLDYTYRFYTLFRKIDPSGRSYANDTYKGFVYYRIKDTTRIYYYRNAFIDVSSFIKTTRPSYLNYSTIFYHFKDNNNIDYISNRNQDNYHKGYSKNNILQNKQVYDLLTRNNSEEIRQVLSDFLKICNQHEINHNLTDDEWFKLIYHPENFELKHIIRSAPKETTRRFESETRKTTFENFYANHITDYYIDSHALQNVFENIEDIKTNKIHLESIHFFIWLSFFLSALVFTYRITGLKPLLLTLISIGVLTIIVILLTVSFAYVTGSNDNSMGYFMSYLTLIIGTIILSIPLFFNTRVKKMIVSICLNISILTFGLYVLLIILIISLHQSDNCNLIGNFNFHNKNCFTLITHFGVNWSYILFFISLLFICFYTKFIKDWKALPEG